MANPGNKGGFSLVAIIASATLAIVLILGGVLWFVFKSKPAPVEEGEAAKEEPVQANRLPTGGSTGDQAGPEAAIEAEKLTLADFYKKPEGETGIKNAIKYPINAKSEVVNFYDIARIINLENQVADLNGSGVATLDNPFSDVKDFYQAYDYLIKKNIPVALTSDFAIYYHQHVLASIFSDIKENVFYGEVWKMNKKMFEIADGRYRFRRQNSGASNDPLLEAEKMEAAFFAVSLALLKPSAEEIDASENPGAGRFPASARYAYEFSVPDYLSLVVDKEVGLIREAEKEEPSPVLLYKQDYKDYSASATTKEDPRKYRFFLASKWLNAQFPLYYKGSYCPDCLLDKEDWNISLIAAALISADFAANQEIKNEWAKIYKVISFFEGLRKEVSYLQYHDSLVSSFGESYKLEEIFPGDRELLEANIKKVQAGVLSYSFPEIEGGWSRTEPADRSRIGMRILQEAYWPDKHIFSRLAYPYVTKYQGPAIDPNKKATGTPNTTYCMVDREANRCRGFSRDMVNLIQPLDDDYFRENTRYENYLAESQKLKTQISGLNPDSWLNNGFWSLLGLGKMLFNPGEMRDYFSGTAWRDKNLNTLLGSWVNLQLPALRVADRNRFDSPGDTSRGGNFVEPNLEILLELEARSKMLKDFLSALKITSEGDKLSAKAATLEADMRKLADIARKELLDEKLSYDDNKTIINIAEKYTLHEMAEKRSFRLSYKKSPGGLVEDISGVKFAAYVYSQGGNKYMAIGPIYNYKEGGR